MNKAFEALPHETRIVIPPTSNQAVAFSRLYIQKRIQYMRPSYPRQMIPQKIPRFSTAGNFNSAK